MEELELLYPEQMFVTQNKKLTALAHCKLRRMREFAFETNVSLEAQEKHEGKQ